VMFDYELAAIDKHFVFWAYAISMNVGMFAFLVAEVFGFYEKFDDLERALQQRQDYRKEQDRTFKPLHYVKSTLNLCQWILGLMIYAASTFMVAPIAKMCAKTFDCIEDDGQWVLVSNPSMKCWSSETGHKQIAISTLVLFPLFLLGLIPYAVVIGDPNYVQQAEILDPPNWVDNWSSSAARQATVLNQGPWHPNPRFVFRSQLIELFSKAVIPFISVLLTERPRVLMGMLSGVGLVMLMSALIWTPRTEPATLALVIGLRVFTFLMMLIGLSAAILDDPSRNEPIYALCVTCVLVPLITLWRIYTCWQAASSVNVKWKSTLVDGSGKESESRPLLPP